MGFYFSLSVITPPSWWYVGYVLYTVRGAELYIQSSNNQYVFLQLVLSFWGLKLHFLQIWAEELTLIGRLVRVQSKWKRRQTVQMRFFAWFFFSPHHHHFLPLSSHLTSLPETTRSLSLLFPFSQAVTSSNLSSQISTFPIFHFHVSPPLLCPLDI